MLKTLVEPFPDCVDNPLSDAPTLVSLTLTSELVVVTLAVDTDTGCCPSIISTILPIPAPASFIVVVEPQ